MSNTLLPTSFTVGSDVPVTLASLLLTAGFPNVTSDSVASQNGYIKNNDTSINLFIGFGDTSPDNVATIAPLAGIEFLAGMNVNQIWLIAASSTISVDFVEGASSYTPPSINGVIGTIDLDDNTVPKGDSNNLVNSRITDDGTDIVIDSQSGTVSMGDLNGVQNSTVLTLEDSSQSITANALILSTLPTGGIGYGAGAGGAQTQATDKTHGVTSNTITTAITMNNASLAAGAIVAFTFTNSAIASTDQVICTHQSGGTSGAYTPNAFPGSGSAVISVRNNTAGALAEAIVLRVSVYKAVSA